MVTLYDVCTDRGVVELQIKINKAGCVVSMQSVREGVKEYTYYLDVMCLPPLFDWMLCQVWLLWIPHPKGGSNSPCGVRS